MAHGTSKMKTGLSILVAEDDPHDQMLFVMAVADCDFEIGVSFSADGEELIADLRRLALEGALPDILVLDMRMPRLNGHEVLDVLRDEPEICPETVGVFSSSHRQQDIERSLSKGAAWHEVKPSRYRQLLLFLERLVAENN
jgi:CheY-like chemotaxis protein